MSGSVPVDPVTQESDLLFDRASRDGLVERPGEGSDQPVVAGPLGVGEAVGVEYRNNRLAQMGR